MMQAPVQNVDKVEYIIFDNLNQPEMKQISDNIIEFGFRSDQWVIQFQTITKLRQANKHYSMIFLNQLLVKFYKNIIAQVQNLRSNNSKQALTLLTEVFQHQNLNNLNSDIIRSLISTLFAKSVSEKGFIKKQALKAIDFIPKINNQSILEELMLLTKSNNGNISELAIKIMNQMLEKNKVSNVDEKFLKDLSANINGKRSVVQKQAKQILIKLKNRIGEEKLESLIDESSQLDAEQSNTLKRQLKNEMSSKSSKIPSLKDFLNLKKQGTSSI